MDRLGCIPKSNEELFFFLNPIKTCSTPFKHYLRNFIFICSLNVLVVSSANPGVGKTLFVQRLAKQVEDLPNNVIMAERLKDQNCEPPPLCATIPFNDKKGSVFDAVGFFLPHTLPPDLPFSRIFHLDCSCTVCTGGLIPPAITCSFTVASRSL